MDSSFSPIGVPRKKNASVLGTIGQNSSRFDGQNSNIHNLSNVSYFYNEDAFASILYKMFIDEFSEEAADWEMDTISIVLKKSFPDIQDVNVDKIQSIVALNEAIKQGTFTFFNDVACFHHTTNTFNGMESDYDFLGFVAPQHIVWAMKEMERLYPDYKLDEDPAKFLGASFHVIGALVLPEELEEYQEFLDYYNHNTEIVDRVKKEWEEFSKDKDLDSIDDQEDVLGVQMLILQSCKDYCENKDKQYLKDMATYYGDITL